MIPILPLLVLLTLLSGCANHSTILLPSSGTWTANTVTLGPVVACQGGNMDFTDTHKECNQWPLSIPSLPHPETHHTELKTKAAQQYRTDVNAIILKDVQVIYNTELVGTIRGWKATALAGTNPPPTK